MASKQLGHEISEAEAQELVVQIGNDGKVDFDAFKKWWYFGKTDFESFRLLVKLDGTLAQKLKAHSSKLEEYFKDLAVSSKTGDEQVRGKVFFGHTKSFTHGIGVSLHGYTGQEWENLVKEMPSYYKENLALVGVELEMKDETLVPSALEVIKQLLSMLDDLPQVNQARAMGATWAPRGLGKKILLEATSGGMIDAMASAQLEIVDTTNIEWNGQSNMHLFTECTVEDLKSGQADETFGKLCHFQLSCEDHLTNLSKILGIVPLLMKLDPYGNPNDIMLAATGIKYFSALKEFNFTIGLDTDKIAENLKKDCETFGGADFSTLANGITQSRDELLGMVEMYKEMIDGIVGPFKEVLQGVNLDKLSIFINCSKFKTYIKLNIHLPGLTSNLNEMILS